jgi:protein-disulfide isomerase
MLSTWKLLVTTVLLSSAVYASQNSDIEDFLEEKFSNNPNIVSLEVNVVDRVPIEDMKGWDGVIVDVTAEIKAKPKNRDITQKMIWFTNGKVITKEFNDLETGLSLADLVAPSFLNKYYKSENLIYGNKDAKHKVAIFSDPLCPFCKSYVPKAIKYMKKYPNKFAIYYYHFPLEAIHPASVALTQAAVIAEKKGVKDVVLKLYDVKINAREKDTKKILKAFNKKFHTQITESDLKRAKNALKQDAKIANDVMVQGTPTIFFDGKLDKTKKLYKEAK